MHPRLVFTLILLVITVSSANAETSRLERLLMPGPLIEAHKKYENKCEKCHETFDRKKQTTLCRTCHEKIDDDIKNKKEFHGKYKPVSSSECRDCHTDHKGRLEDIVLLDELSFDHKNTEFELKGSHKNNNCKACHKPGKKHRDAPTECYSCHKNDDIHKGDLGKKCKDCHSEKSWKKKRSEFNHDETDFPLKYKHQDVSCDSCHPGEKYKDTPKKCYSCHRINDVHRTRYGDKCKECHTEKDWKKTSFNHDRDTDYLLKGKHTRVKCDTCHKGYLYKDKLETKCYSCHKEDDEHRGKNGRKCEDCHSEKNWDTTSFDHTKDTKFPLKHKHSKVSCTACHKNGVYEKTATNCYSCHKDSDEHKQRYGKKCHDCHDERSWNKPIFDHTRDTDYTLKGNHKSVVCDSCHTGNLYENKIKTDCISCHKRNDIHRGNQGEQCDRCHSEQGWNENVKFDHDLTHFPLIGLHIVVPCEECHISSSYKNTKKRCVDCHKDDDEHKGKLSNNCEQCHNPNSWNLWRFDHNNQTDYELDGEHDGLDCLACHRTVINEKIELPTNCYSCHRSEDVHRGGFGRKCEQCHTTQGFNKVEFLR